MFVEFIRVPVVFRMGCSSCFSMRCPVTLVVKFPKPATATLTKKQNATKKNTMQQKKTPRKFDASKKKR